MDMMDGRGREYASPSQWIAEAGEDFIIGAFDTKKEAVDHYPPNVSVVIRPIPQAVARRRFVWAVSTLDDRVDSFHGGDASGATKRSDEIGGKLILFLAEDDDVGDGPSSSSSSFD